jgi:hypothetical protein
MSNQKLAEILQEAADDIAEFGWAKGPAQGQDPNGTYPRCVWIAAQRARERYRAKESVTEWNKAERALMEAAQMSKDAFLEDIFDLNDSQSDEEGQAWAFGVLISASHILNPALAVGENKTDSASTDETDIGSTGNVGSRLLSFLKRFIWVR